MALRRGKAAPGPGLVKARQGGVVDEMDGGLVGLEASPGTRRRVRGCDDRPPRRALQRHDGNVSMAARDLGLSRSALYRRLGRHGL